MSRTAISTLTRAVGTSRSFPWLDAVPCSSITHTTMAAHPKSERYTECSVAARRDSSASRLRRISPSGVTESGLRGLALAERSYAHSEENSWLRCEA